MLCVILFSLTLNYKFTISIANLTTSPGVSIPVIKPQTKDLVLLQTTKWYSLGLQLGIEDTELDVIEENNPKDINVCQRKMFKAWLKITPSPSYQQLVEALYTVGEISEADRLCKKYGKTWLCWKLNMFGHWIISY